MAENYKEKLKLLMDEYVHFVYGVTKEFPKEELFGSVSQWRRATLSIVLNYIEGYARKKPNTQLNFFETAYASLKESKYILFFSLKEKFINQDKYNKGLVLSEEIGRMLWSEVSLLERSIENKDN